MARITRLSPQVRRPDKVSVFLDGRFAFGLLRSSIAGLNLHEGMELTGRQVDELARAAGQDRLYERVLRLLARRDHAEAELLRKLARGGAAAGPAARAVARARREGYVDDARFAAAFAREACARRGWAPARARRELRRRGVEAETAESAVRSAYLETDLEALAIAQARSRARQMPAAREVRRRRLAAYLARRGFPVAVCRRAVDEVAP